MVSTKVRGHPNVQIVDEPELALKVRDLLLSTSQKVLLEFEAVGFIPKRHGEILHAAANSSLLL